MLLCNAFSLNMVAESSFSVNVEEISVQVAKDSLADSLESAVGHQDTAAVLSSVLGTNVPTNRITVALKKGSTVIVGQYKGPRLAEGTTNLPDGTIIQWFRVSVI